jgi:TIR domain-containing protein/stringent starvation protein B
MSAVFLSYAREDFETAERLYMDLRRAEIDVWMDKKSLLPGQNWEHEIRKAIRAADHFLALISTTSVQKRGFVQREMRTALDVLDEVPTGQIYLIPVRIDDVDPPDFKVQALNRVDLFPSYRKGFERLVAAISDTEKRPLVALDPALAAARQAPIEFTPFRSFESFIRFVLQQLPESAVLHDREMSYYLTYRTQEDGVSLPDKVKAAHPAEITVVLRAAYLNLEAKPLKLSVDLMFDGKWESIVIPYSAIDRVVVPQIGLHIQRIPNRSDS